MHFFSSCALSTGSFHFYQLDGWFCTTLTENEFPNSGVPSHSRGDPLCFIGPRRFTSSIFSSHHPVHRHNGMKLGEERRDERSQILDTTVSLVVTVHAISEILRGEDDGARRSVQSENYFR